MSNSVLFRETGDDTKKIKLRRLLIVDDDARLCRALSRRLESSFSALHTASTLEDADRWLTDERITHLICGQNLGEQVPKGTELVARWRREHPSIKRVVLFTGDHMNDAVDRTGLDAIICKTTDFGVLTTALGL